MQVFVACRWSTQVPFLQIELSPNDCDRWQKDIRNRIALACGVDSNFIFLTRGGKAVLHRTDERSAGILNLNAHCRCVGGGSGTSKAKHSNDKSLNSIEELDRVSFTESDDDIADDFEVDDDHDTDGGDTDRDSTSLTFRTKSFHYHASEKQLLSENGSEEEDVKKQRLVDLEREERHQEALCTAGEIFDRLFDAVTHPAAVAARDGLKLIMDAVWERNENAEVATFFLQFMIDAAIWDWPEVAEIDTVAEYTCPRIVEDDTSEVKASHEETRTPMTSWERSIAEPQRGMCPMLSQTTTQLIDTSTWSDKHALRLSPTSTRVMLLSQDCDAYFSIPNFISHSDFQRLVAKASFEEQRVLRTWFRRDDNCTPWQWLLCSQPVWSVNGVQTNSGFSDNDVWTNLRTLVNKLSVAVAGKTEQSEALDRRRDVESIASWHDGVSKGKSGNQQECSDAMLHVLECDLVMSKLCPAPIRESVRGAISVHCELAFVSEVPCQLLVISGPSGSGKTSLLVTLAKTFQVKWGLGCSGACSVLRLYDRTVVRRTVFNELQSLVSQLTYNYGADPRSRGHNLNFLQTCAEFSRLLSMATIQQPLLLILDSVDTLIPTDGAALLECFPAILPPFCAVVVSSSSSSLPAIPPEPQIIPLEPLEAEESQTVLDFWLQVQRRDTTTRRTVVESVRENMSHSVERAGSPLYCRLAALIAQGWHSWDPPSVCQLKTHNSALVNAIFARMEDDIGESVVSSVIKALCTARHGLAEAELVDIVSLDDEVLCELFQFYAPRYPRLPLALWQRVWNMLEPLLIRRRDPSAQIHAFEFSVVNSAAVQRYFKGPDPGQSRVVDEDIAWRWICQHDRLADYFSGLFHHGKPLLLVDGSWFPEEERLLPEFDIRHPRRITELASQLLAAGRLSEAKDTILDCRYVEEKLQRGMMEQLLDELDLACSIAEAPSRTAQDPTRAAEMIRDLTCFRSLLLKSQSILLQEPFAIHQLAFQEPDSNSTYLAPRESGFAPTLAWKSKSHANDPCVNVVNTGAPVIICHVAASGDVAAVAGEDSCFIRLYELQKKSKKCKTLVASSVVLGCCIGPDGSRMVAWLRDNTIAIFDVHTNKDVRSLTGHTGEISKCSFHPNGNLIASCGADNVVIVWDVGTGHIKYRLQRHDTNVLDATFSHNGKVLVSGDATGTVMLWDVEAHNRRGGHIELSGFGANVNHLQTLLNDEGVGVLLIPEPEPVISSSSSSSSTPPPSPNSVVCLDYGWLSDSEDEDAWPVRPPPPPQRIRRVRTVKPPRPWTWYDYFFVTIQGRKISIQQHDANEVMDSFIDPLMDLLEGHSHAITHCIFTHCDENVITASLDHTIRLWSVRDLCEIWIMRDTPGIPNSLSQPLPTAFLCVTFSHDSNSVRFVDEKTGTVCCCLRGHGGDVILGGGYVGDAQHDYIVTVSRDWTMRQWDCNIALYNENIGAGDQVVPGHGGLVSCGEWSSDGGTFITGSIDGTVKVWDKAHATERFCFNAHTGPITACDVTNDGSFYVSASKDKTVRLWRASDGKLCGKIASFDNAISYCKFSHDSKFFLTASGPELCLWDAKTRTIAKELKGHQHPITTCICVSHTRYVTGSEDGSVMVWDITAKSSAALHRRYNAHPTGVTCLSPSPNQSFLVTGGHDGRVRLWNLSTMTGLVNIVGHQESITTCLFCENSMYTGIITGTASGEMKVWSHVGDDSEEGEDTLLCEHVLNTHTEGLTTIATIGSEVISASVDGTVRVWDVSSWCMVGAFYAQGSVQSLAVHKQAENTGVFNIGVGCDVVALLERHNADTTVTNATFVHQCPAIVTGTP